MKNTSQIGGMLNTHFQFSVRRQGVFKYQRCLSLPASNLESVAKLPPMAEIANSSLEFGIALGMMRYVPSVSCSIRHSCSGMPLNAGTVTNSASSVAARARFVPAMVILKYGEPG